MTTRELDTELFGRDVSFRYSERWIGYAFVALRVLIGWVFLLPGIKQIADPNWSVRGFLLFAVPEANPFYDIWITMATEWAWLMTPMNQLGLFFIGLGLITGTLFRLSAVFGGMMMIFYWLAHIPPENGYIVTYHLVYVFLLFGLGAFGAGRILGVDAKLEQLDIVKRYPRLRLLLG